MKIAELMVVLGVSSSVFDAKMDSASKKVGGFGRGADHAKGMFGKAFGSIGKIAGAIAPELAAAGAALEVGNKLKEMADHAEEAAERTVNLARELNISTRALQGLSAAAQITGVSAGSLQTSLVYMTRAIGNAQTMGGQSALVFRQLGLNLRQVAGESGDQQFKTIASALRHVHGAAERTSLQMKIFGRSSSELSPLLAQSNSKMEAFAAYARRTGNSLSAIDLSKLAEAKETSEKFSMVWSGFTNKVGAEIAPLIESGEKKLMQWMPEINKIAAGFVHFYAVMEPIGDLLSRMYIDELKPLASGLEWVFTSIEKIVEDVEAIVKAYDYVTGKASHQNHQPKAIKLPKMPTPPAAATGNLAQYGAIMDGIHSKIQKITNAQGGWSTTLAQAVASIHRDNMGLAEQKKLVSQLVAEHNKLAAAMAAQAHAKDIKTQLHNMVVEAQRLTMQLHGAAREQMAMAKLHADGASKAQVDQLQTLYKQVAVLKHLNTLKSEAASITQKYQSPSHKLAETLAKLHEMFADHDITKSIYDAAVKAAEVVRKIKPDPAIAAAAKKAHDALVAQKRLQSQFQKSSAKNLSMHVSASSAEHQFSFRIPASVLNQASASQKMLEVAQRQEQHQKKIAASTAATAKAMTRLKTANIGA